MSLGCGLGRQLNGDSSSAVWCLLVSVATLQLAGISPVRLADLIRNLLSRQDRLDARLDKLEMLDRLKAEGREDET